MPRCYTVAVAQGSALDSTTNNYTLFGLVETVNIGSVPVTLPVEAHVYWSFAPNERNVDFEMRTVVIHNGTTSEGPTHPMRSATARLRFRLTGLELTGFGNLELRAEWRELGASEWVRTDAFWPLEVNQATTAEAGQPSP